MGDSEKATGFDALNERLDEIRSSDEDLNSNVIDEVGNVSPEVDEVTEEKEVVEVAEVKDEVEGDSEPKFEAISEDKENTEENVYSPNYQYKFQDEMFDFDERVKSSIKSKEDEEYFRDLYTKSSAMEIMKTRSEEVSQQVDEWQNKYTSVETKAKESDNMINYFTSIMDGVSRGDPKAVNDFLSLCKVEQDSLARIGVTLAGHLDDPQGFNSIVQRNQVQRQEQQVSQQSDSIAYERAELARSRTELEVQKALSNPEISEMKEYVDNTWGEGTFEKRVWSEGESLEAQNKSVSFEEIPNIVKNVADWFGKARPASNTPTPASKEPVPVVQQIIDNNTASLPRVQGEKGIPKKPLYEEGSGVEGLRARYKNLTGNEW